MTLTITERIDAITLIPDAYMREDPPSPKSVKIELTGRCNYRCGFCALVQRDKQPRLRDDMGLDFFKAITKEMFESGVEEIGVFYIGESLLCPQLTMDAIRYLKEIGVPYVFLTTNGSLCTPEIAEGLMNAGLDSLKFSINASSDEQFEEVMGVKKKLYWKSQEYVKSTWEVRERIGASTRLYASSIYYDGEQGKQMEAIVERIKPYVDEHYWLPLYSFGSVAAAREKELGFRPTAGNQGRLGAMRAPLPCWNAFTEGHVRADGTVSLCGFDADGRFGVGNLHGDTWMNIWHGEKFREIRRHHLRKDVTGTVCETCAAY